MFVDATCHKYKMPTTQTNDKTTSKRQWSPFVICIWYWRFQANKQFYHLFWLYEPVG